MFILLLLLLLLFCHMLSGARAKLPCEAKKEQQSIHHNMHSICWQFTGSVVRKQTSYVYVHLLCLHLYIIVLMFLLWAYPYLKSVCVQLHCNIFIFLYFCLYPIQWTAWMYWFSCISHSLLWCWDVVVSLNNFHKYC